MNNKNLLLLLFIISFNYIQAKDYLITDFGARTSATINTKAIQSAIDKCHHEGGGRVIVPTGSFVTGTLIFRSNVELHLTRGAALLGSKDIKDYPDLRTDFVSFRTTGQMSQLLYADKANNIAITGSGTIDGCGKDFPHVQGAIDEGITRPHVLQFIRCKDVLIKGVTMTNSACWMQHYLACEDLRLQDIHVFNHNNYNNDAIDVDACKNVIITGCHIDSDDDGITFKSTCGIPCQNVVVSNSLVSSHCNAIKMGTETNGGFVNFSISNCVIKPSTVDKSTFFGQPDGNGGIALEIVDGGKMDGISISNITIEGTIVPFFIRLGNRGRAYHKAQGKVPMGSIQNVIVNNINARGAKGIGCSVTGIPGFNVKNVQINNFVCEQTGGEGRNIVYSTIPEHIELYPEGYMFGTLPSYGFYVRHVENITFNNVETRYLNTDARPAFYFDDVKNGTIANSNFMASDESESGIIIKDSKGITIHNNVVKGNLPTFLEIIGGDNNCVNVGHNFYPTTCKPLSELNSKEMNIPKIWNKSKRPSLSAVQKMFKNQQVPFTPIDYIWDTTPTHNKAWVRVARSDEELFLQFKVQENGIKALCSNDKEGMPCDDSCVEFFVREGPDKPYFNFEVNCIGSMLVEKGLTRKDRKRLGTDFTSQVRRETSLGKKVFAEKKGNFEWFVTMAIPFSIFMENYSDLDNRSIFANFYNCAGKKEVPHWLTWSPILTNTPAFHEPNFFGKLNF